MPVSFPHSSHFLYGDWLNFRVQDRPCWLIEEEHFRLTHSQSSVEFPRTYRTVFSFEHFNADHSAAISARWSFRKNNIRKQITYRFVSFNLRKALWHSKWHDTICHGRRSLPPSFYVFSANFTAQTNPPTISSLFALCVTTNHIPMPPLHKEKKYIHININHCKSMLYSSLISSISANLDTIWALPGGHTDSRNK